MGESLYVLPSENIGASASITARAGSTADPNYPVANLVNLCPAIPGKILQTAGGWDFDYGAPVALDGIALIHHNLTAGLDVRVQAHNLGNPVEEFERAITIPAWDVDGWSVSPWIDLRDAPAYRFWTPYVVGVNAGPVAVGEIVMASTLHSLPTNLAPGFTEGEDHAVIEHRTTSGVSFIYLVGARSRVQTGELPAVTDAGAEAVRDLLRDAGGRGRPFLVVPDPDVNEAWFVRSTTSRFSRQRFKVDVNRVPFALEEVSRGLKL